ncbi:hypothetical protein LCGC14_0995360 [marine sediment metagenome]|uniref:Uncharacterized protein n=1 Tax=marine sediment metagenome TaxID=412755 RepID=A0A0F9RAZ0_9ZZZZ
MASKTSKKDKDQISKEVQSSNDTSKQMGQFLSGINHAVVTFFNPDWDTGSEEDRWYMVLPIDDTYITVKTQFSRFTRAGILKDLAVAMLHNPNAIADDAIVPPPEISNPAAVKLLAYPVPVYPSS